MNAQETSGHEADDDASNYFTQFPARARSWRLRDRSLQFGKLPLLMGVVNVTPDSFSDGGDFFDAKKAIDRGLQLAEQGADILDIGGESTRPYATPVDLQEELQRTVQVIRGVSEQTETPISIDTSKAEVARQAIAAGAQIINDVTSFESDPQMLPTALELEAGVCAMHMQGTPQTMQDNPSYGDVVKDIFGYLQNRLHALIAAGMDEQRICLDPGIGFGKTHQHNLTLLAHCSDFHKLGRPVLVGHSRKGFIAKVLGDKQAARTAGTIGVALALAQQGVQILRVHDVAAVRQALLLFEATGALER